MDEDDQRELFNTCVDILDDCLNFVNKYATEEDKARHTEYLKSVVCKDYCNIDLGVEKSVDALKKVEDKINALKVTSEVDVQEMYKECLRKVGEEEYLRHPVWYRISKAEQNSIEEVEQDEMETAPANTFVRLEDSLLCSQTTTQTLDPLTKLPIKKACRNKKCGHLYEYETIMVYLKSKRKVRKCPYMGCGNNKILPQDIEIVDE